jgi:hypothetical protein
MLTVWSEKYVEVLFRSELGLQPRFGRFPKQRDRDKFIAEMAAGTVAGARIEPLPDGLGVRIIGAGPVELLGIVKLARQCGGEVLFPGALPG